MKKAEVINVDWANQDRRQIKVTINAQDSVYIQEPNGHGFPQIMNSGPMIEGFNYVLEFGHEAVNAMKGNENFMELANEVRELRKGILNSDLASRVRELLTALDYEKLSNQQAKCVLLIEKSLRDGK